jgi:hypothetical protein
MFQPSSGLRPCECSGWGSAWRHLGPGVKFSGHRDCSRVGCPHVCRGLPPARSGIRFPDHRFGNHRVHFANCLRPHAQRPGRHGLPGSHTGRRNRRGRNRRGRIRRTAGSGCRRRCRWHAHRRRNGLSGLFLVLLLPIGVLLGSLAGLRRQTRQTRVPEQPEVGSMGLGPAEGAPAPATAAE